MSEIGEISVKVNAKTASFEKGMRKVDKGAAKISRRMKTLGRDLEKNINQFVRWGGAIGGLALGAFTKKVIEATKKQEMAFRQLQQGIESTNAVVGYSADELKRYAAELQKATTFGDEDIIAAQSQLLTFTSITEDRFKATIESAMDLSVRMGTDLKSSVIQLGKALNDPLTNLSLLSRSGIQFTKAQKDMVRQLIESGRMADAQNVILKELQTQFGGSAKAARDTFGGALESLGNAFGDLLEGGDGLNEAKDRIEEFTEILQDPKTLKMANELTSALIAGFSKLVVAMKEVPDFAEWLGESLARLQGFSAGAQDAQEEINEISSEMNELADKMEAIRSGNGSFWVKLFGDEENTLGYLNAQWEQLSLKLEAANEKLRTYTNLAEGAATATPDAGNGSDATEGEETVEVYNPLEEMKKIGQAQLQAVLDAQNAIRKARLDAYDKEIADLEENLNNGLLTQKEFDAQKFELMQQKSDLENNILRMTYDQQQSALESHANQMTTLGASIVALNEDLAGGKIDPDKYKEKLDALLEKLAEHKAAVAELENATIDEGNGELDPITAYEQETIGLLEAMGLRFQSTEEAQLAANQRELDLLKNQLDQKLITEEQYAEKSAELKRNSAELERSMMKSHLQDGFAMLAQNSKKVQKFQEGVAIYQAGVKGMQSAVDAWQAGMSTGGPWAPVVAAAYTAASLAKTAALIKSIKGGGQSKGAGGAGGASAPTPQAPTGQSQSVGGNAPDRTFNIDFAGNSSISTDDARNLLELINEQAGDNVEINLRG